MADIRDLVPNNKYDISAIEKLKQLMEEEIAPILPAQGTGWNRLKDVLVKLEV